jgi:hypothetical protein
MSVQVHQISLSEDLVPIMDEIIDHIISGNSKPAELNKLREWLLDEGWREMSQQADGIGVDEIICFDPSHVDSLELSDDSLRFEMFLEDDETITDEMRLDYARDALHSAYGGELAGGFASWCWPMVHVGQLVRSDGDYILVGMLGRFQGPGSGYVAEWCEFFPDIKALTECLEALGYILNAVPEEIDAQILLSAWGTEDE